MGKILYDVQPFRPRGKGIVDVAVKGFVEGRDQLPDVTDQVKADNAQRDAGQTGLLGVGLARAVPVPKPTVTYKTRSVSLCYVGAGVRGLVGPPVDVQVLNDVGRLAYGWGAVLTAVCAVVVVLVLVDEDRDGDCRCLSLAEHRVGSPAPISLPLWTTRS